MRTLLFVLSSALIVPGLIWAQFTIQAPDSAPAGSKVEVNWSGPSEPKDFITIVEKGTPEKK
jgi:Ca-activated chloride channel family protein